MTKVSVRLIADNSKLAHDAAWEELRADGWHEVSIIAVEEVTAWVGLLEDPPKDNTGEEVEVSSEWMVTAEVALG